MTKCEALGYVIDVDPDHPEAQGNWASGHTYGTELADDDKAALLEYLKSL